APSKRRATPRSASATGSSWLANKAAASKAPGPMVTPAIARTTARASGTATRAPVIRCVLLAHQAPAEFRRAAEHRQGVIARKNLGWPVVEHRPHHMRASVFLSLQKTSDCSSK